MILSPQLDSLCNLKELHFHIESVIQDSVPDFEYTVVNEVKYLPL